MSAVAVGMCAQFVPLPGSRVDADKNKDTHTALTAVQSPVLVLLVAADSHPSTQHLAKKSSPLEFHRNRNRKQKEERLYIEAS